MRAPLPPRHSNLVLQPHQGSSARASFHESGLLTARYLEARHQATGTGSVVIAANLRTMSRGNFGGKSVGRMDPFTWLSNVKVGGRRGSSSGPGSGADSADVSRLSSRSRPPSGPDRQASELGERRRSESRSRGVDERREGEGNQSLQDECVAPRYAGLVLLIAIQDYICANETCAVEDQVGKGTMILLVGYTTPDRVSSA